MSRIGPLPDRKLLAKVSCRIVTQWSHDGQETVGEGSLLACHALVLCRTGNYWRRFPLGLLRSGPMTDGKLSAKGFLLACHALVLCRTRNCLRRFPVGLLRNSPMTDRKLLAKVSCRIVTQWSHDGQETVCEGFPAGMLRSSPMMDRKLSLIKKELP